MARIFITGSSDGLGQLAAKALVNLGHQVVLHARNEKRAQEALIKIPGAETVVSADLTSIEETIQLGEKVNALGKFDAVIHNAGLYNAPAVDLFHVNTLAPYILTCLIQKSPRLIYLSSGVQKSGRSKLDSFRTNISSITYSDTKLHVVILCKAVARMWTDVYANAINPGWVPTKMGGSGAPDDLKKGYETQVWLAVSDDEQANVSGHLFFHQKEIPNNPEADDVLLQEKFMDTCRQVTGITFPGQ